MTIDVGALRKFQDTWGPVLEAIPAVLDAVAKQDDFARLEAEQNKALEKAKQEVAQAYEQADKRLEAVNAQLESLTKQQAAVAAAIASDRANAAEAAEAAQAAAKAKLDALTQQVNAVQARINGLNTEYASKRAAAEAEHASAVVAMAAEIKALEDRKAEAEKALEVFRAKFG